MKASDWISVKDRLPDIGIRVLVYHYLPDGSKSGQIVRRVGTPYEVFGAVIMEVTVDEFIETFKQFIEE